MSNVTSGASPNVTPCLALVCAWMPAGMSTKQKKTVPYAFRLPPSGKRDPHFGMARTWWEDRCLPSRTGGNPPIESASIADNGGQRAVRVIKFASAKKYIEKFFTEGATK